ncbi:serine/threonine-protein kinase [Aridibaculum aurantiacum]|uniref:serine/threonine-protein kinase n=1 Tax=Aridibaculum aurantiacum TaxID=2810307 RepID=UPI001A96D9DC|nr:serine/threonine-protein kinase [Aridibaculum aurantiacum]
MSRVFTITAGLENMGAMKTGGQGSVYKGKRIGEIITAIKLLPTPIHSESDADKNFIAFTNEVEKLKKVNEKPNPNVVKILSSGITDTGNLPFIEMEYIEGPDLEELLQPPHEPLFTIKEVVKVANHLSNALAHCHKIGIKHGDIKSNNVKYNIHTGNYMLLDFGLAVMSDEQRRTSLRHAGAIEFMAPEQAEGTTLFETDVYSFGVILFELLAGTVPFPLKDKSETSRNQVMVAHLETAPPDMLQLRKQALPAAWSDEKKVQEMQVPAWLVNMIYRCLEKKPQQRFENGDVLHDFIWHNLGGSTSLAVVGANADALAQENRRLRHENEQLQLQLKKLQQEKASTAIVSSAAAPTTLQGSENSDYYTAYRSKKSSSGTWLFALLVLAGLAVAVYFIFFKEKELPLAERTPATTSSGKALVAEYKVVVPRAYFHDQPDETTRRNAWAIPSDSTIKALDERNGFIYTEITNHRNQVSKGWLRKEDLKTVQEAGRTTSPPPANNANTTPALNDEDVKAQLRTAQQLINSSKVQEALPIYENLLQENVPEAMYHYADLALRNENKRIDCKSAFELLQKASNAGHTVAKRTLGFLYVFAEDRYILEENNYYARCTFSKNLPKGSKLLVEAMVAGDSLAARYVRDLNAAEQ